jgi:hypothetical protein
LKSLFDAPFQHTRLPLTTLGEEAGMAILTRTIGVLGTAAVLLAPVGGAAQTQADFDVCNEQAKALATNPSAFPGGSPGASSGGSTMTSPGTSSDANREPNVTGRISGSAGSPGTAAGTTSGGLSGMPPSGSIAGPDVQLRGMAPAGRTDDAYRQAYRDCMKSRGF